MHCSFLFTTLSNRVKRHKRSGSESRSFHFATFGQSERGQIKEAKLYLASFTFIIMFLVFKKAV